MLLLPEAAMPTSETLRARIHALFPDSLSLSGGRDGCAKTPFENSGLLAADEAVSFEVPGGLLAAGLVKERIPDAELEWPLATAYFWPEARAVLATHTAHILVTVLSTTATKLESMYWLTQAVAALGEMTHGLGVYWGSGGILTSAQRVLMEAQESSMDNPPYPLWIALHPISESTGWSGYSHGLEDFGHLDFEIRDSPEGPEEVLGRLAAAVHCVLTTGREFQHGDTFKVSETESHPVTVGKSRYHQGRAVCLLGTMPE